MYIFNKRVHIKIESFYCSQMLFCIDDLQSFIYRVMYEVLYTSLRAKLSDINTNVSNLTVLVIRNTCMTIRHVFASIFFFFFQIALNVILPYFAFMIFLFCFLQRMSNIWCAGKIFIKWRCFSASLANMHIWVKSLVSNVTPQN
jgi:hypothetical protein